MDSKKENRIYVSASIFLTMIGIFACRPVIAIGWNEFLFLIILIGILLGPPLYIFIRRVESFLRRRRNDK